MKQTFPTREIENFDFRTCQTALNPFLVTHHKISHMEYRFPHLSTKYTKSSNNVKSPFRSRKQPRGRSFQQGSNTWVVEGEGWGGGAYKPQFTYSTYLPHSRVAPLLWLFQQDSCPHRDTRLHPAEQHF